MRQPLTLLGLQQWTQSFRGRRHPAEPEASPAANEALAPGVELRRIRNRKGTGQPAGSA